MFILIKKKVLIFILFTVLLVTGYKVKEGTKDLQAKKSTEASIQIKNKEIDNKIKDIETLITK